MSRVIVSIFRRGAANMTNEVVANQSEPGVSYLDNYRTIERFPNAHAAVVDTTPLAGQKGYGINKKFTAFLDRWQHPSFRGAAFMTLGTPAATRSHFYEQGRIDCGGVEYNFANVGYFNRFVGDVSPPAIPSTVDLLSVGNSACRMTIGLPSTYAASKSVTPLLTSTTVTRARAFMDAAVPLNVVEAETGRATAQAMLETNTVLTNLPLPANIPSDATGAPKYPVDGWGQKLRDVARMIIAGIPSRVICCDYDGWDHHSVMGGTIASPAGEGKHAPMLKIFNDALNAFIFDMEQSGNANRVLICSQTEFHRTMRENGNKGSDHGQSSHAYVWGATVNSDLYGKVLDFRAGSPAFADPGSYQSPFPNRLLKHTMDYRDFQRMQCEWLAERTLTPAEVTAIWGATFTSNMTTAQRAAIAIN